MAFVRYLIVRSAITILKEKKNLHTNLPEANGGYFSGDPSVAQRRSCISQEAGYYG